MRTKALLLGASPRPFIGEWVWLEPATWRVRVATTPYSLRMPDGRFLLFVEKVKPGGVVKIPIREGIEISGAKRVRVVVAEEIEGIETLSVFLEEVRNVAA